MKMAKYKKGVKCYIVNKDVSIFDYELLDNCRVFQVEMVGETKRRYILGMFSTMKEAKEYIKNVLRIDIKKESE